MPHVGLNPPIIVHIRSYYFYCPLVAVYMPPDPDSGLALERITTRSLGHPRVHSFASRFLTDLWGREMHTFKSLYEAPARRAFSLPTIAALLLAISAAPTAQAIPPNQKDYDLREVTTSLGIAIVPGTFVTVNNDVARNCVIQLSADVRSRRDLVFVGYTVDSTNRLNCDATGGPVSISDFGGTVVWVRPIPRGLHTIRACYGVADIDGDGVARVTLPAAR
ncbi:MAG: hypothetical protein H0V62_10470 [Gammaproteobacteria bacterium]|nr:hypothetical protein [Gammaproteobacteria bacterium]